MAAVTFCPHRLRDALSRRSMPGVLEIFCQVTQTTATLFDVYGQVLAGPIAGSGFMRLLMSTSPGRAMVLDTHRAAMRNHQVDETAPMTTSLTSALEHCAARVNVGGCWAGTLTLLGHPRQPLSVDLMETIARTAQLDYETLQQAAGRFSTWTETESSAAREMVILLADLLGQLCVLDGELNRRIEELSAVYKISGLVTASLDLREVLSKVAATVCDVMKVKACSIRLLDEATGRLSVAAVHNLSEAYVNKGPVNVSENPIDAEAVRGEIVNVLDAPNDPRTRYPDQARNEGLVSLLVCGMIYRGKAVGVLRVYSGEPHVFTPFEQSLLQAVASQIAVAIINTRLFAEALEAERYQRQLNYAGEVQRRMIPASPPCCERLEIGTVYRPTFQVGGDFYDFIVLPKSNLGLAIADVSGKGVPASLQMASVRAALRVNAYHTYHLDRIMSEVNRHLCRDAGAGEFATVFYGVVNSTSGRLTYCNAGHNPPILLSGGVVSYLETGGTVLGVDPDASFERSIVDLKAGDILLLYTDGAVECLNFADEQFGTERLVESLRRNVEHPAQRIAQNILWDIRRFRGLADRTDDLTMVVLKVL